MKNRILFFVLTPLVAVPVVLGPRAAAAQNTVAAQPACQNGIAMADLGFVYYLPTAAGRGGAPAVALRPDGGFSGEPLIAGVNADGPGANRLQDGDRIARVNGFAVTTREGTVALRDVKPGKSIVLTIRRGDRMVPVTITAGGYRCPVGREALTVAAAAASGRTTASSAGNATGTLSASLGATAASGSGAAATRAGTLMRTPSNAGWLGLGFDCANCGQRATPSGRVWYFTEPPTIYNVDTGSPAYNAGIRRGDVLLKIDGKDVKAAAAGARLGLVKPGETLRLTYRRGSSVRETSLKVAPSPVVLGGQVALRSADNLLKSTQELRASVSESRVRSLIQEIERSRTAQEKNIKDLEVSLRKSGSVNSQETKSALNKLRYAQEAQASKEKEILRELLRAEQEGARQLDLVEEQVKHATLAVQPSVFVLDSIPTTASAARGQRLRYSGSVGSADVEVRGPGSISVQGDGEDLVIVTSDAVIRIKARQIRDRND